ncbi:MAG: hypothetical protein J6B48_09510 [Clostridia bacterium]|nr:hypothetical protein [Clostridia bacterium]
MAILLNRKYGSRLECLYYILQSCYKKYGTTQSFELNDFKYDDDDEYNVHCFCQLTFNILEIKCCPYLINPLDSSKCYATQSLESDSTKSKAVSDIGGSLEALGFIKRVTSNSYQITESGKNWATSDFCSREWEDIARNGVISYGLIIGFLSVLRDQPRVFSLSDIYLGYPRTEEAVNFRGSEGNNHIVNISTGSEDDSVTRTKSRVISWCVSVGLIEPVGVKSNDETTLAHIKYRDFINSKKLTVRKFKKTSLLENIFNIKIHVDNPLAYSRLHKMVRSMRENGGEILRLATLQHEDKILNRRFVFTYILNHYSKNNASVNFEKLVTAMNEFSDCFFTEGNVAFAIMATESQIADFAGIPFIDNDGILTPLTTINDEILCEDAPSSIVNIAKQIIELMEEI